MEKEIPQLFKDVIEKWKISYISIIFLTVHFQNNKEGGLRLLHYRYALVKNDEISNEWKQQMKDFFGWKLKQLNYMKDIHKCITTRQNLVKKLLNLVEWDIIDQIPETKERDYPLYRINETNYKKIDITIRKNRLIKLFSYSIDDCSEYLLSRIESKIEDFLEIKKPKPPK